MTAARALILNVEDNEPKRYLKTRALSAAGYEVLEATTAARARELVLERQPDLALLDVKLPDGSGRDLCAWMKTSPETAQIAVIQTSALLVDSHERVASLDAGADGYLIEPIEPEELLAHVRALLRLRNAERERQAALTALQDADRRKDEFLAMLAHELRNPLAPIRNAVEILRSPDRNLRERARSIVARQVLHLSRLVDDLLEVSRITQRKVMLKRAPVRLRTVVDAAVEVVRPLIDEKGQTLDVHLPQDDLWIEVDAMRMSQVLGNLLNNAAKYTPAEGNIRIAGQAADGDLELEVSDDGMGISPELLPHVFELFTQDARSSARSQGGLGIGLSLVRGILELHGGSVTAESGGLGCGSTFRLRLPLGSAPVDAPESDAEREARASPRRVLIVEDHADAAETLRLLLQRHGHDVSVVEEASAALASARTFRPQVVLMDLGLPGMDGFELATRLRALPETSEAALIAVSGYGQQRDIDRAAAAGFDMHFTKPVEPSQLARAIAGERSAGQ